MPCLMQTSILNPQLPSNWWVVYLYYILALINSSDINPSKMLAGTLWHTSGITISSKIFLHFLSLPATQDILWCIRLSSAQRVILIGHGPGCRPLIDLVNRRGNLIPFWVIFDWHHPAKSVTKFVKAFIQVVGLQKMPSFPADVEDVRVWYQNVSSLLYLLSPLFLRSPVLACHRTLRASHDGATCKTQRHPATWNYPSNGCALFLYKHRRNMLSHSKIRGNAPNKANRPWFTRNQAICERGAIKITVIIQSNK